MSSFYRPASLRTPRPSRTSRKRKGVAGAVLATVLVLGTGSTVAAGVWTLRFHPRFTVRRDVLEGVPDARRSEAEELTDGWIGQPLLFADVDGPVSRLSSKPWVARAAARRVVPDTIAVQVTARGPVALSRRGGSLWSVDRSGTGLGPYAGRGARDGNDFPLLDAEDAPDDVTRAAWVTRGAAFVERLRSDDSALLERLSEVVLAEDGLTVVDQTARATLRFGLDAAEPHRAASQWRAFLAIRGEASRHGLGTSEADLRFADRIVLPAPVSSGHGTT